MEWVIRVRLRRPTLLGFRLVSELLSDSDCDIRCEGYGRDRHTSVFLVYFFFDGFLANSCPINYMMHTDLQQLNMYASWCIIKSTRLCIVATPPDSALWAFVKT